MPCFSYDHLDFHEIGPDRQGFLGFWTDDLRPALADVAGGGPDRKES